MGTVGLFEVVKEKGNYLISYLTDGWTKEIEVEARSPSEAMMKVQNLLGSICNVTFVERSW